MLLLVSCQLKRPDKDYTAFHDALKAADGWWHHMESTWVLATREPVTAWAKRLVPLVDEDDNFLVVDISKKARNGWLPEEAWDWLSKHDR